MKNPKQKAKELLDKMNNQIITIEEWGKSSTYAKNDLKRKVLIAVDELINCTPSVDIYPFNFQKIQPKVKEYWKEVKQEIELL